MEDLEIDYSTKGFELITKVAQPLQTIINIEKSRLTTHRFIPDFVRPMETEKRAHRYD